MPNTLHRWILSVLGIWIPKYQICEEHCSPYEHIYDRYFDRYLKTIALACRGGGKSYNTGLECWMKARFRKNWGAVILGGSLDQSEKSYKATQDFWAATQDLNGKAILTAEPMSKITRFANRSWYRISTASTKSTHGPHQPALFLDEIDEMDRNVFHGALMQPQTMNGHRASWSFTSTRHKAYGLMSEWVDNAEARGYKLYTWCILEVMEACVDYRCSGSTCKLHEYCGGRMKPVIEQAYEEQRRHSLIDKGEKPVMGFNTVEDTLAKVELAAGETFDPNVEVIDVEADLFCRKPSRQGLVYKEYDANVHGVMNMQFIRDATKIGDMKIGEFVLDSWPRGRTFDFGHTNPMVVLDCFIDPMGRLYVFDEIYETGLTIPELVPRLTTDVNYEFNVADISGASERKMLGNAGIKTDACKHPVTEGLTLVRNQLKTRSDGTVGIYVNRARCPWTNWELSSAYRYPKNRNSEDPDKSNDHAADAIRNLIAFIRRGNVRQSRYKKR